MKNINLIGKTIFWAVLIVFAYFGLSSLSYAETLKFVQLSDVHLSDKTIDTSYKVLASSQDLFKDEVEQLNAIRGLNFVMVTGDLVDKPREELLEIFCKQANKLKAPWYFALGNHDVAIGSSFKKDVYLEYMRKHNKNYDFDNSYYSFVPQKGFKVIVMDATIDNKITGNGVVPEEQLKWLDCELKAAEQAGEIPMIFLHHPLHEPFPSFHHRIINAEEFYAVLHNYKIPIAIFSGHYHATKIYQEENILHVSTPSIVTYPCAFRIITVENHRDKVVFNIEFKETNLKDVQKKAKLLTFSANLLKGEETDQNAVVTLDKPQ